MIKFPLFSEIGSKNFLAWVSPLLKQEYLSEGQKIYSDGDTIQNFYFMTSGAAAFTITK
jgi:hypothetical protein